ncbi:MAG: ATP-binding cassette domain-containing protein [Lachnospiraceae bacterium]|nr:ATP-binding cassette domain-containing protein [Lachnospiraceae bacterium]
MIDVEHISKRYGKKEVLRDISFSAKQGECIAIAGANGCGKSTLLSILAGTLRPDAGEFHAFDHNMFKEPKERERIVGYVPQENPLIPELTARDNLRLWYCDSPYDMEEELEKGVLAMLGIGDFINVKVSNMSGGMKKRLSIGCSVANDPPVLIMDEPSAALDLICKSSIRQYMAEYKKRNGIILITTHDEQELDLCDRILIMRQGVLHEEDPSLRGDALLKAII